MTDRSHERLSELYLAAVELPEEERGAFIESRCAGDEAMAGELRQMLNVAEDTPSVVHTGAMAFGLDPSVVPLPEAIGPYRVLEQIGEGGMGVVYRARQEEPIQRDVAVKLIRIGIETKQILRRFEHERQVLARMNHPNIAHVIDAGTTELGRSYVAMEYVDGVPIHRFCDRRRLTVNERLDLFRAVCDGVQHAHQNAIIHRDLKPSNILVTTQSGKPVPKIIDFGIAKTVDSGPALGVTQTELGQFIGTPEYMSPEQTAADSTAIDTRTDVYALGVLLYELLTGTLPFRRKRLRKSDLSEIHRIIREEDPPAPSTRLRSMNETVPDTAKCRGTEPAALARMLHGDLDAIVTKALEKEPDRRYESPAALAADVRRHREHEPVSARPLGWAYRTRKFVRKHRYAVAAGAVLAVGIVAVTSVMTVSRSRIAREQDKANREARTAAALSTFVGGLLRTSDAVERGVRRGRGLDVSEVFDNVMEKLAPLDGEPLLQATMMTELGEFLSKRGDNGRAVPLLDEAVDRLQRLKGPEDPGLFEARHRLAVALTRVADYERAETMFRELIEAQERVLGPEHESTLRTRLEQAELYRSSKSFEKAERILVEALGSLRRTLGPDRAETFVCAGLLASVYLEQGRYGDARALLEPNLDLFRDKLGAEHLETRSASYNLAAAVLAAGEETRAIEILNEIAGGPPTSPVRDPHFSALWGDPRLLALGERTRLRSADQRLMAYVKYLRLMDRERHEDAKAVLEQLVEANRVNLGPDHPETRGALWGMASHQAIRGVCAAPLLTGIREWYRQHYGEVSVWEAEYLWHEAQCLIEEGEKDRALAALARAVEIIDQLNRTGYRLGHTLHAVSHAALSGDLDQALVLLERVVENAPGLLNSIPMDRSFAPYRDDPRFQASIAEMKRRYPDWSLTEGIYTGQDTAF